MKVNDSNRCPRSFFPWPHWVCCGMLNVTRVENRISSRSTHARCVMPVCIDLIPGAGSRLLTKPISPIATEVSKATIAISEGKPACSIVADNVQDRTGQGCGPLDNGNGPCETQPRD